MVNKKKPEPKQKPPLKRKAVQIVYRSDESQRLIFANQLIVQHDGGAFYLHFYESLPPAILGTPEEIQAQIEALEAMPAYCVAKIAVPVDRMDAFLAVLATNANTHKQTRALLESERLASNGSKK